MARYRNPTGYTQGTEGADRFAFTRQASDDDVTIDAGGGYDTIVSESRYKYVCFVNVEDSFNSGELYGRIDDGPYGRHITFFDMEAVTVVGSRHDDGFRLKIGDASAGLPVDFDAGAGTDSLELDFDKYSKNLQFDASGSSITSSYGVFADFEQFTIIAGAGDDDIATGNGNDTIHGGAGTNRLSGGGGDDLIYSTSLTDFSDGGIGGYDVWQGNYSTVTSNLSVFIGTNVITDDQVVASQFESLSIGGGQGDDTFDVSGAVAAVVYGGSGADTLTVHLRSDESGMFSISGYGRSLYGSATFASLPDSSLSYQEIERIDLTGGDQADRFSLNGALRSHRVSIDGGGGADTLFADFTAVSGSTNFIVAPEGSVRGNRGQFANLETFTIIAGSGDNHIVTGAGNDVIVAGDGDDILAGGDGNDFVDGGGGQDRLSGGGGLDALSKDFSGAAEGVTVDLTHRGPQIADGTSISGFEAFSNVVGTGFSDTFVESTDARLEDELGAGSIDTGDGNDTVTLFHLSRFVSMGPGNDRLVVDLSKSDDTAPVNLYQFYSTDEGNTGYISQLNHFSDISFRGVDRFDITFGGGDDYMGTGAGGDRLHGGAGNDELDGGAGRDVLHGDSGTDILTGGDGSDRFVFAEGDTSRDSPDAILDFSHAQSDVMDLRAIDANALRDGDQRFDFIGTAAFSHTAGELSYSIRDGAAFVSGDVDGDGAADFTIRLDLVSTLESADFKL